MRFLQKLNEYVVSLEQDEQTLDSQVAPAASAEPAPEPKKEVQKVDVAPEGYTEMVRLMAKALVMNVPPEAIDDLFTTKITGENVEAIREGLEDLINTSSNYQDNPERLENLHFKTFVNSINEKNFYNKFKEIVGMMKKYSNDIDFS
jgi:hypothetical protein